MMWFVQLLCLQLVAAAGVEAHFVNSSGAPFPGPIRHYSLDTLDVRMIYEKGFCGCFCKLTKDQYWTICRGKECLEVPKGVKLMNKRLKITGTMITSLVPADLADYPDLLELDFNGNLLKNITEGSFAGLHQLVNLSITSDHLQTLPAGVFIGLDSLRSLRLNKNKFMSLSSIVPALVDLPQLRFLALSENTLSRIDADDFTALYNSSIETLELNNCDLRYIASEAFLPLTHLTRLTLAVNIMPDDNLVHVFYTMRESGLRELDLSHLGFEGTPPRSLMEVLSRTNLSRMDLSDNTLPRLSKASFPLMPNILELDLSHCDIISIENETFGQFPHLKHLDLSFNCLGAVPAAVTILPQLQWLNLMHSSGGGELEVYDGSFSLMANLTYLDLSGNRIGSLSRNAFAGLVRLRELHLSNCTLYRVEEGCFQHLTSLAVLQLEGNAFSKHNFSSQMFRNLDKLEYLNMDRCRITFSHEEAVFAGAPNLKVLSLRQNEFQEFGLRNPFYGAYSLTSLDLTGNDIRGWNIRLFQNASQLEVLNLADNDIPSVTPAMLADFARLSEVNLLGNPLDCDCQLVSLRPYVMDHHDTNGSHLMIRADHCQSPDEWRFKQVTTFLLDLQNQECQGETERLIDSNNPYIITLCVLAPLIALLAIMGYAYYRTRWLIRLHLFRKRLSKTALVEMAAGQDYIYDAFVSYSNEDHGFVARLVGMLENMPPHYKLCVYERDFTAGTVLNDCIMQSIATSRKVVLIVSEHFVQSHWCLWELHLAQHSLLEEKRNGLVLVVVGKLKPGQLPPTLRFLMKTRIYLEWDPDPRKQHLFWERLRGALAPSSLNSRESSTSQIASNA